MSRKSVTWLGCAIVAGLLVGLAVRSAQAVPEFKKAWDEKYVGDKSTDAQKTLEGSAKTAGCNVCHDAKSKSKKDRNAYGNAIHDLGLHKKDKKDKEKIEKVFKEAEAKKNGSESYGDRIKAGKLPFEQK
jgi:hypothetical protein